MMIAVKNKGAVKPNKKDDKKNFLFVIDFKSKRDIYLNKKDYKGDIKFEDLNEYCIIEYTIDNSRKDGKLSIKNANLDSNEKNGLGYILKNALIIQNNGKEYDNYCDAILNYAKYLEKKKVTATTLRNIYRKIQLACKEKDKVLALKKLRIDYAYLAGRNSDTKDLTVLLDALTRNIEKEEQAEEFQNFMEALVAYHKYITKSI